MGLYKTINGKKSSPRCINKMIILFWSRRLPKLFRSVCKVVVGPGSQFFLLAMIIQMALSKEN